MEDRNRGTDRIALLVQYDGTGYNGWQIQKKDITIQKIIQEAVKTLTGENCSITASGRTDSGVHAIGQVAHFDLKNRISLQRLCGGLNGILPLDISIKNAFLVNNDFHSRYSAVERVYQYILYNYPLRTPFMRHRSMWLNKKIDVNFLKKTASYLIGEHDFASFCKKKSAMKNTVREIKAITIEKDFDLIKIKITGNAFLHNMIRIIIGTMIDMYNNGKKPEYIKEIIKKKNRDFGGKTAPASGLYLLKIKYDPDLATFKSAF